MEQHPVPRNITGFQFHLIGDMTLRQFGYLVGGCAVGFLLYKIIPIQLFKLITGGTAVLSGVALAFFPIQERPLDKWLVLFIKSIYSPTQFLWQKEGLLPSVLTTSYASYNRLVPAKQTASQEDAKVKLHRYLQTLPQAPHQALNLKEKDYLDKTLSLFNTTSVYSAPQNIPHPTPPPMSPAVVAQPIDPPQTKIDPTIVENRVEPQIEKVIKIEEPVILQSTPIVQPKPIEEIPPTVPVQQPQLQPVVPSSSLSQEYNDLQKKLEELAQEKERLFKELELMKNSTKAPVDSLIVKPEVIEEKRSTIKSIPPKTAVDEMGLPTLPTTPNIIIGVVKDEKRRVVPNILITIKDKYGVPLRAFKTNKLGQFATATPLPNGTYLIETEDPLKRYTFDIAEITLSGKVFLPIEISAKSEKEVVREQLSKALFGNPMS